MKFFFTIFIGFSFCILSVAQPKKIVISKNTNEAKSVPKPKLVVGIVIDQMRWDYLYRFQPLFSANGGFKRMMNDGYNCNNTLIPYTPTVTACGHTCVYTGSVPNIHGITGNNWWDKSLNKEVYCTEDKNVIGVGNSKGDAGKMSPKNMLTTTIGDELRLATNFQSRVVGVAFKDRGAILPAGHSANAAYWYDRGTGEFISSTYYVKELPKWVNDFNSRKIVDSFYNIGWQTKLTKETYLQYCTEDVKEYEGKAFGKDALGFPYNNLAQFINKDYNKIISTPFGDKIIVELAKSALVNEKLGANNVTDMLTISFSSPDYIGHNFGPNSWELLDEYVRLDEELGKFFDFLDAQYGKGNYLSFLTADHAVAHVPGFMQEHKLPGGVFDYKAAEKIMNTELQKNFGADELIVELENYQITLNHKKIDSLKLDKDKITKWVIEYLKKQNEISHAFELDDLMEQPMNATTKQMLANGFYENRSGDIQFILKPGYIDGMKTGTTHGLWNPYDAHIPLLWYGWGIKKGSTHRETYMTDIAATVAALLNIQMPSGCIGKVITEVMQ
jgi:predicted AlkP superfamily pyrophosphatase or phosphodiesterase